MPDLSQPPVRRAPGFRCSRADGLILLGTAVATALMWSTLGKLTLLFPIVLIHFFLFCNVSEFAGVWSSRGQASSSSTSPHGRCEAISPGGQSCSFRHQ